jgi:hypothetical protein
MRAPKKPVSRRIFLFVKGVFFDTIIENHISYFMTKMKLDLKKSYLNKISQSVGSRFFRNLYFKSDAGSTDIMKNGDLSCAHFVSCILYFFGLIGELHATVASTVEDMEASGWKKIKEPRVGAILVWEAVNENSHIGFYIGNGQAISNSSKKRMPIEHRWDKASGAKRQRRVTAIFWHKKLT